MVEYFIYTEKVKGSSPLLLNGGGDRAAEGDRL